MTVSIIPEEVNRVRVTFSPPNEPNGNITAYLVYIYNKDRLVKNISLDDTAQWEHNRVTVVIEGLKAGNTYSIQVKNTHIRITSLKLHGLLTQHNKTCTNRDCSFKSVLLLYWPLCRF